ncbi:hypothetical protein [Methylocapsa sp. S129]|uniref:hypothetical protein n=1 Tax=Methylocapsa sp. S129 TaxID=1641869 RepID=UPI00131BC1A6|nr:hypothetical protein [Methylocapsa sp. S129]
MQLSMWTYPWDVQDCGFEATVADLRERAGLTSVSLAASYHAGRFLQPRSPVRKVYFPEDGTIYFQPEARRWDKSRLKPKVADIVRNGDVLRDFVDQRARTGLSVSAWTVCLHNMRLGLLHPDVVTRNAFGDANPFSLCPSHPDAREYVCALVEDMSANYQPDAIELETPCFMPYAHGYHHEKDGVGLTAEDDFLLSLCFCPACLARAAKTGVDGEAARRTTRRLVAEAFERDIPRPLWPDFRRLGLDALRDHPEIQYYARWRTEPVTSLVAEIRNRAHPASKIYVIDILDGWLGGCDAAALGRACDGMIFCVYDMSAKETGDVIAKARAALGPGRFVGAGFRVFHPEMADSADLVSKTSAAVAAGAEGINFYNFGLVPAARLDWVRAAAAAARAL